MLICKFCNKECKNLISVGVHEGLCHDNPQKRAHPRGFKGKSPWHAGLSAKTNETLKNQAKKISKSMKSMKSLYDSGYNTASQTQEYWTEDRREQRRQWRKELHINNPESHPNRKLANNKLKMTYPELVAFNWFTDHNVSFEHQKKINSYFVDFCIDNVIIEIDGERWHPIGNEKDKIRDEELTSLGYEVIRIRSKERIEDRLTEIYKLRFA